MQIWDILTIVGWIGFSVGVCMFMVVYYRQYKTQSLTRSMKILFFSIIGIAVIMLAWKVLPRIASNMEENIVLVKDLRTGMVRIVNITNIPEFERRYYETIPEPFERPPLINNHSVATKKQNTN